jgi:hypothetical protein
MLNRYFRRNSALVSHRLGIVQARSRVACLRSECLITFRKHMCGEFCCPAFQIMTWDSSTLLASLSLVGALFPAGSGCRDARRTCISCKQPRSSWCVCVFDWLVSLCHVPGQQNPAQQCMQLRDWLSVSPTWLASLSGCCERAYAGGEGDDVSRRYPVPVEAQSLVSSEVPSPDVLEAVISIDADTSTAGGSSGNLGVSKQCRLTT